MQIPLLVCLCQHGVLFTLTALRYFIGPMDSPRYRVHKFCVHVRGLALLLVSPVAVVLCESDI